MSGREPLAVLRAAGRLLYGAYWQEPAARLLGVTPRSIRYWLAGKRTPPARIVPELEAALRERLQAIRNFLNEGA